MTYSAKVHHPLDLPYLASLICLSLDVRTLAYFFAAKIRPCYLPSLVLCFLQLDIWVLRLAIFSKVGITLCWNGSLIEGVASFRWIFTFPSYNFWIESLVRDFFLHVEAMLDQISMILLQLEQYIALAALIFLGRWSNPTIVFVHHLYILLV